MYYLTDIDTNYTVKGSRDPLAFQVIWQEAGRKLIPHLSTVSSNIKDFQILCLAYAVKKELNLNAEAFEQFFVRFEQMMAYTRLLTFPNEGFNGIDKVRKILDQSPNSVRISYGTDDQILTNQLSYGIWGKYNRPFHEIGLPNSQEFEDIFTPKIKGNQAFMNQVTLLSKKKDEQLSYIEVNKLNEWADLLDKPKYAERKYFVSNLLQDNCDLELLSLVNAMKDANKLTFLELTNYLISNSKNEIFKSTLNIILNTERVLSPLNRIFRYLQKRSYWKKAEIESDEYISEWRTNPETTGFDQKLIHLASLLQLDNYQLVLELVKLNDEISKKRKSAPWMILSGDNIEVKHFEGGFLDADPNPLKYTNPYFLTTYTSLHKQLN